MEKRIASTRQAAARLGMPVKVFLQLRDDPEFPEPVHGSVHHLWWDLKAIGLYFDKKNNIQDSTDWNAVFLERLNQDGNISNEICGHKKRAR